MMKMVTRDYWADHSVVDVVDVVDMEVVVMEIKI
jgi:hypothetical protein